MKISFVKCHGLIKNKIAKNAPDSSIKNNSFSLILLNSSVVPLMGSVFASLKSKTSPIYGGG